MDVVEFVIAPDELGMGTWPTLEPLLNGVSLVEVLKWCERRPQSYAGLIPERVLEPLRALDGATSAPPTRVEEAWAARAGRGAPAVLAFDTATAATTVAVTRDGETWEARHDPAPGERPGHATRLLELVAEAMAAAAVDWDEVARIVVGVGPGSFTGLRIGVSTARGLAQARGVPLVGVSTLRLLAAGARVEDARPVLAVVDARRGEAFVAAWASVRELLSPAVAAPEELARLAAGLERAPLAVGDGALRFRSHLEAVGTEVPADGDDRHLVSARHWRAGRPPLGWATASLEDVAPDYLRLPDAEIARRAT